MRILTVRRCPTRLAVLLALALPVLLALPAPAATKAQVLNCTLPVQGTVTAIDADSRTFMMNVTANGVGVATVWVQKASVIVVREVDQQTQAVVSERPARFEELRVGHRVAIQAMCLDDGRLVVINGAILQVSSSGASATTTTVAAPPAGAAAAPQPGSRPAPAPGAPSGPAKPGAPSAEPLVVISGNVLAKTAVSLTVGGKSMATVTVGIDSGTKVGGQRTSLATVMLNDTVRIEAVRTSGGRLRARAINVLAIQVKTIIGTITAKGNGYIVIDNRYIVHISTDTLVLVNGVVRSVAELTIGAKVAVTATVEPVAANATGTATTTVKGTVSSTTNQVKSTATKTTETVKAVVVKVLVKVSP